MIAKEEGNYSACYQHTAENLALITVSVNAKFEFYDTGFGVTYVDVQMIHFSLKVLLILIIQYKTTFTAMWLHEKIVQNNSQERKSSGLARYVVH